MRRGTVMSIENRPTAPDTEFSLPTNLTEWVDAWSLLGWVEEEVDKLDWSKAAVRDYLDRHPDYRPRVLLCLLAYAYATQVFGSEEIVRNCYSDTIYRLVCEGKAPERQELIRFRRDHRGLLKEILTYVFVRAVRERWGIGLTLLPPGLKRSLLENALERLNIARHMDSMEE
jgi:hypothetical protein